MTVVMVVLHRSFNLLFEMQRFWASDTNTNSSSASNTSESGEGGAKAARGWTATGEQAGDHLGHGCDKDTVKDNDKDRDMVKSWVIMPVLKDGECCSRCEALFRIGGLPQ